MLKEQTFFGINSWKCFHEEHCLSNSIEEIKNQQIVQENKQGYIVLFNENELENGQVLIECYKKHATSILKFIIIGKFPILSFSKFKNEIDKLTKQSTLLQEAITKPEFNKYKIQKKLYFNLE